MSRILQLRRITVKYSPIFAPLKTIHAINCCIIRFPACMHKTTKLFYFFLLFSLYALSSSAQQKFTISGFIKDASSGESLLGANVYLKETLQGTQTNQYGFYSLTVPTGKYTIVFSYIGFEEQRYEIDLNKNIEKNIDLGEKSIETKEVTVSGEREDRNVDGIQMGRERIEIEQLKKLPAFMGEVDILKSIQLLPGVQSGGEGHTGFYVRVGSLDQNLILLDEATVYNASHMSVFCSCFNSDPI